MKKPLVLIAAIVAVVGLGTAVAVAKETIKVGTSVTLDRGSHAGFFAFVGDVKASRGCQEGRTVTLTRAGTKLRSDKTNNRGRYLITFPGRVEPWSWTQLRAVAIERKTTKDNGDTIVCKEGRSNLVPVTRIDLHQGES